MVEPPIKPLNVILILADQWRADYVGRHPEAKTATPCIDALCGEHVFNRCTSVNPVCQPARTALLTGRYTRQIGMTSMSGDLHPDIPTFAQSLQSAGYHTIGVGKFHYLQGWSWTTPRGKGHNLVELRDAFHQWGFAHVWQVCGKTQLHRNYCDYAAILDELGLLEAYRDNVEQRGKNVSNAAQENVDCSPFQFDPDLYIDRVTGSQAIAALEKRPRDQPFFAQISFCSPHPPYDPPAETLELFPYEESDDFVGEGRRLSREQKAMQYRKRRAYKAMIHEIDLQVGRIHAYLEAEGLLENTMILFSSDHGEMMGDHGLSQKTSPYWQASRVPLYIRHPAFPANVRHDCLVESVDITATILDAAGVDAHAALCRNWPAGQSAIPARSLVPVLSGRTSSHRDFSFSESYGLWEMVELQDFKYVRHLPKNGNNSPRDTLWNVSEDPDETKDVSAHGDLKPILDQVRDCRLQVIENYPPCQTRWTQSQGRGI